MSDSVSYHFQGGFDGKGVQVAEQLTYPSSVMYAHMKQFGGISNKDLAAIVFADDFSYGGAPISQRVADRTFLTRNVVHVAPATFTERAFGPLPQVAERISSLLISKYPGREGKEALVRHFNGAACEDMCAALRACGLNDALYRNITGRVEQMELSSDADKVVLLVLQFVSTGCLGDVSRATEITLDHSRRIVSSGFRTTAAVEGDRSESLLEREEQYNLGLCRVSGGSLVMPAHALSTGADGTEIGSLATASGAINDVDETVSKRHARVFRDEQGRWFVEGLGSTNGTSIVRGDTKEREVVEPARADREPGREYPPVRIYPSDMLCLADTTQFMVVAVAG